LGEEPTFVRSSFSPLRAAMRLTERPARGPVAGTSSASIVVLSRAEQPRVNPLTGSCMQKHGSSRLEIPARGGGWVRGGGWSVLCLWASACQAVVGEQVTVVFTTPHMGGTRLLKSWAGAVDKVKKNISFVQAPQRGGGFDRSEIGEGEGCKVATHMNHRRPKLI